MLHFDIYSPRGYCYVCRNLAIMSQTSEKCPECGRGINYSVQKTGDDALLVEGGRYYPDFFMYHGDVYVSAKAVELFESNAISGYSVESEVAIFKEEKRELRRIEDVRYYYLNITGSVDLDLEAMKLKKKHVCPACGRFDWSRQRLHVFDAKLDMDTWNQSDLCRIASFPGVTVCTEKVAELVTRHKLKGVILKDEKDIFRLPTI